jgi:2,4-dienoyl-CoA reductase-like NADH-dependent reductase (Old Yellow Enzyme family)
MIFQPLQIKGVAFKNRILRSSVGGRHAAYNGMVTDTWRNFEKRFAGGGIGGMISTTFNVDPQRQSPLEYPSIADDKYVPQLRQRIGEIQQTGCKYIVQIGDPGAATQTSLFAEPEDSHSSSNGFDLLYGYTNRRTEMSDAQIRRLIGQFAAAAGRVKATGADGIEVTAEKGYVIHQFLNPGMNRRRDEWGKDRFRLLEEIIAAVRREVGPEFLLGVRLAAVDCNYTPLPAFLSRFPWVLPLRHHIFGNGLDETLAFGRRLKALGVDYLHIVAGYGFINPKGNPGTFPVEEIRLFVNATRHLSGKAAFRAALVNLLPDLLARPLFNIGWRYEEGISLDHAARFRRELDLPVITNGGYQTRAGIERALAAGCDLVSMARALIARPDLVRTLEEAREHPAPPCTHCNRCCARTATSPLGCYEEKRFPSRTAMLEQIMAFNRPD